MNPLVLSLFPGIGLLDRAFEEEGFCVVRGPDLLWGGDVKTFHPPEFRFDGIIGGPPCQLFSGLANFAHRWRVQPENLIGEFERVVSEARPEWFLMENVPTAPLPGSPNGYTRVADQVLNNRWLGEEQSRARRFSFCCRGLHSTVPRLRIETTALEACQFSQTVTASHGGERRMHAKKRTGGAITRYSIQEALRLQGLPEDFLDAKRDLLTARGKLKAIAEGVPLPMGRAIARAVKAAMYPELAEASA